MRHLRITLDFMAQGETPMALAELRAYVAALVTHQGLGTQIGPRDLERAGFSGVHLVEAELWPPLAEEDPRPPGIEIPGYHGKADP